MDRFHYLNVAIRFVIYSNLWISLSVAGYCYLSFLIIGAESEYFIPSFAFLSTLFIYNYQRVLKSAKRSGEYIAGRNNWIERNRKTILFLAILGGAGMITLLPFLSFSDLIILGFSGVISLLYVVPERLHKFLPSLRDVPYIKIHLIAISWVSVGAILPIVHVFSFEELFNASAILLILEKYLFVLAITIPFDIRDMNFDAPSKRTIPQIMGEQTAIMLSITLLIGSLGMATLNAGYSGIYSRPIYIGIVTSLLTTIFLVRRTDSKKGELFYTGLLDGTPIFQLAMFLLFSLFS